MKFRYFALGAALLATSPAYAHDAKGSHGGRVTDAGAYHVELVAKDNALEIFLIGENDKPVDPKGFKGVAVLNLGGKAERITLAPSEKNNLRAPPPRRCRPNPRGRFSSQRPTARLQPHGSTDPRRDRRTSA